MRREVRVRQPRHSAPVARPSSKVADDNVIGMLISEASGARSRLRGRTFRMSRAIAMLFPAEIREAITTQVEELNRRADKFAACRASASRSLGVRSSPLLRANKRRAQSRSAVDLPSRMPPQPNSMSSGCAPTARSVGSGIRHREYKRGRSRKCNPER